MATPRYGELIEYLAGFDIDANRVKADTMTASGYEYVAEYRDGRPMYVDGTLKLRTDWTQWPSKEVFETVTKLYNGQIVEPELKIEQLPEPVQANAVQSTKDLLKQVGIEAKDVPAAVVTTAKLSQPNSVTPADTSRAKRQAAAKKAAK